MQIKWDNAGLVTVVVQDGHTGEVRMVAHANEEAICKTLSTGQAHFFSRSRGALWRKGETSGHVLDVHEVWADCDGDALVYTVTPHGPSCHTGRRNCFYRPVTIRTADATNDATHDATPRLLVGDGANSAAGAVAAGTVLMRLEEALKARTQVSSEKSYTQSLLMKGPANIMAKLVEEAGELGEAITHETSDRVINEAADVIYHLMVALLFREVSFRDVVQVLATRSGRSGHEEKASR